VGEADADAPGEGDMAGQVTLPAAALRPSEAPEALTVDQVAALLQVDRKTVYSVIRRGEIPVVRLGRVIRVSRQALQTYLNPTNGDDR
jgi:excisionase family DNA binding protein